MRPLQLGFICATFLVPPLLWLLSRKVQSPRLARGICWGIAAALIAAYIGAIILKAHGETLDVDDSLPMQLCDWAALATVLALTRRSPLAFELAYFWGLAGTVQALFTPAIEITDGLRVLCFLLIHSSIPAGVLWLMFEYKLRPRPGALLRVMLWSELYLACALTVNAFTGGNYGFLTHRPSTRTLLDYFSDSRLLYVAEINLTGLVFFALLAAPWWRRRKT